MIGRALLIGLISIGLVVGIEPIREAIQINFAKISCAIEGDRACLINISNGVYHD